MNIDSLRMLDCAIRAALLQLGRVVEEAASNGLANFVMLLGAAGFLDLHSFHEALQLVSDVPRPFHALHLAARPLSPTTALKILSKFQHPGVDPHLGRRAITRTEL